MINVAPIWLPELQQQNYRIVLEAMSRPGHCQQLFFDGEQQAYIALLAGLLDQAVTLADPHGLIHEDDFALLQSQRVAPEQADFILCRGNESPAIQPKLSTLPSPELSATLVILVEKIHESEGSFTLRLTGPGVNGKADVAITGWDHHWLSAREDWVSRFPLGVDILLVDNSRVMALPRTTTVEIV